jgi:Protein of unknown function (DUF3551)
MRIVANSALVLVLIVAAAAAQGQTYDPHYPVCMKVYDGIDGGEWVDCSYTTLPQCRASASGRAAMCEMNPYFARDQRRPARSDRRY